MEVDYRRSRLPKPIPLTWGKDMNELEKKIKAWMIENSSKYTGQDGLDITSLSEAASVKFELSSTEGDCPDWLYDFTIDIDSDLEDSLQTYYEIEAEDEKMRKTASFW